MAKILRYRKSKHGRRNSSTNYEEYERLKETLDVLSDPELMRQIRASEADIAAGKRSLSVDEVFGEPLTNCRKKRG